MDTPLRTARKARGLTLNDLAGDLGVTVGQMSRIERYGTKNLDHALTLSEKLGVPVSDLRVSGERAA